MAITVLKKNRTEAVVLMTGTGSQTITLASLAMADETVSGAKVDIKNIKVSLSATAKATISRNAVELVSLAGTDHWAFDGYTLSTNPTYDIVINNGDTDATFILVLRKLAGYTPSNDPQATGILP
jgi:predicted RNA methylase